MSRKRKGNRRTIQAAFSVSLHILYSWLCRGKGKYHAVAKTQISNNGDIWNEICNSVSERLPPGEVVNGRSIKTCRNRYDRWQTLISQARKQQNQKEQQGSEATGRRPAHTIRRRQVTMERGTFKRGMRAGAGGATPGCPSGVRDCSFKLHHDGLSFPGVVGWPTAQPGTGGEGRIILSPCPCRNLW